MESKFVAASLLKLGDVCKGFMYKTHDGREYHRFPAPRTVKKVTTTVTQPAMGGYDWRVCIEWEEGHPTVSFPESDFMAFNVLTPDP